MNILLVDDDFYSITAMSNLLRHEHSLRIATNGRDAYELFRAGRMESPVQLVVTDIRMPKMSGIDFLKKIREMDEKVPVILVTGHATPAYELEADLYGVYAFITKPLDVDEFMDMVQTIEKEQHRTG